MRGLFIVALGVGAVALIGSAERGGAVWPDGARLWYVSGSVLMLLGIWCAHSPTAAVATFGHRERGRGLFLAAIGLGMLGGALEYDDPQRPWMMLLLPLGYGVMRWAYFMHRPPAGVDPAPLVGALAWGSIGLWPIAVGLLDLLA